MSRYSQRNLKVLPFKAMRWGNKRYADENLPVEMSDEQSHYHFIPLFQEPSTNWRVKRPLCPYYLARAIQLIHNIPSAWKKPDNQLYQVKLRSC